MTAGVNLTICIITPLAIENTEMLDIIIAGTGKENWTIKLSLSHGLQHRIAYDGGSHHGSSRHAERGRGRYDDRYDDYR